MRSLRRSFAIFLGLSVAVAAIGCRPEPAAPSACDPETPQRCSCPGPGGPVEGCYAREWKPLGCTCEGGSEVVAAPDAGATSATRDASAADSATSSLVLSGDFATEPNDEASYIFDQTKVRTYNIVIAQADLDAIDAKPSAEAWAPASLELDGVAYGPYQVRYKGSTGSFRWPCTIDGFDDAKESKCSIKLDFNEADPDGRFFGLKKLNLHSMNSDPSLLRDRLSYALFREHGVPAPRAMHARVLINGKLEGLFVAVEQIDGRFTRARFSDGGKGNLYKDAWPIHSDPNEYLYALETNEDEDPSVERMLAFSRAVATADDAALQALVDPEYLARYMAVDRVIVNDDGVFHFYCQLGQAGANHNYYWYEAEQRLWLIPWDMDYTFDGSPWVRLRPAWYAEATCSCAANEYGGQFPSSCDPMIRQLMRLETEYEREVDAFLAGPFDSDRVDAKLIRWTDQIRPFVIEAAGINHAPTESEWTTAVYSLDATINATREQRGLRF